MMTRLVGYAYSYCIVLVASYTCSTLANATIGNRSHDAYSLFAQDTPQVWDDFDDHEADLGDENYTDDTANIKEVPKLYVFFLLTFQSTFHISDAVISVLLAFLSTFFWHCSTQL